MYLEKLSLNYYRNYEYFSQAFSSLVNIFIGKNAQGKTNLLEAIYYLSTGRTYRPARDYQLILWGNDVFRIRGEVKNKFGTAGLEIHYRNINPVSKEIKVNGLKINKMADFLGNFTTVLFAPEDLNFVKGSPVDRRRLLDNDIAQVSPSYFIKMQKFNRILNQRNHLLKMAAERRRVEEELGIWNQQYIQVCEDIISKRIQVLEKISPLTRLMQRRLTNGQENLEIRYFFNRQKELRKVDSLREMLYEEQERNKAEELKRGITLFGPHRDDLFLTLNGSDIKLYGSQGQHRTVVLAVKLAELEFFKAESGEYPILLLDDVMSELDGDRKEYLVHTIQEKSIQCFITTTEDHLFSWNGKTSVQKFYIHQGSIRG